jgi:uncharacterized protein YndB with AHSA1/START domain
VVAATGRLSHTYPGLVPGHSERVVRKALSSPEHAVSIVRVIDAPAEAVYAAWTDPAIMERWMARKVEADVRVGGRYRNEVDAGEAGTFVHTGEYLVLEPGRRIVQTFGGEGVEASPYRDEFLEVTLRPLGPERTELTLIDGWDGQGLDAADEAATREAWSAWIDDLAKLF